MVFVERALARTSRRPRPALAAVPDRPDRRALTAAALATPAGEQLLPRAESWQAEAWAMYDALGEFRSGTRWLAQGLSRVRLIAAEDSPENDEPTPITDGPAAELVAELAQGIGGQSVLMEDLTTYLTVPGGGWLVGEEIDGQTTWSARSDDEIRRDGRGGAQVLDTDATIARGRDVWRPLSESSLVVRIWRPHKRLHHLPDSPARAALPIMRELERVNRKIEAADLSRLASAGVLVFPTEITFPVREEFQDAADPFMAEWIQMAGEAIARPGTASAVIPIPIRVPGEYVDKIQYIDFTGVLDDKILDKRDSAIRRLATSLDMPPEALLGVADLNHWSAWQVSEEGVKTYITPLAELLAHSLTVGYLWPQLAGSDRRLIVWYDTSELTQRPDRSESAQAAYDRLELSGEAYRRELGFDAADKPEGEVLREQALKILARQPEVAPAALAALTGEPDVLPGLAVPSGGEPVPSPTPRVVPGDVDGGTRPLPLGPPPAPRSTVPTNGDRPAPVGR